MGNTKNSAGKRVFNDVFDLPADLQGLADDVFDFANARVGTSAARQALPVAQQRVGMLWTETDTGFTFVNTGSGAWTLIAGPMPYLVARSVELQSLPTSAWTTLTTWDTPSTLRGIGFNTTTGLITIQRSGVYELDGFVSINSGGAAGNRVARFTKNGVADADALAYNLQSTNALVVLPVRRTLSLVAGDVIRFQALQSAGVPVNTIVNANTAGYETRLSVRFVSAT